jgi:esterase/lipase
MNKQTDYQKTRSKKFESNSDNYIILIHGYTGSTTDFNGLPKKLHKILNATISVPLLLGHGTSLDDLVRFDYSHFFTQVETEIKQALSTGKKVFLGGYSFGGSIALDLATKYPVSGVFTVATPYKLQFPLSTPIMSVISKMRDFWPKKISTQERELRRDAVYYYKMPGVAIPMVKKVSKKLTNTLKDISCPCLTIQLSNDTVAHKKSGESINKEICSMNKKLVILEDSMHGVFYTKSKNVIAKEIIKFLSKHYDFR